MTLRTRLLVLLFLVSNGLTLGATPPPAHDHFRVAIYIPVSVVDKMKDPAWLQKSWDEISSQLKVDKVYIESYRSGNLADDALLQSVKRFFVAHGVAVAGGIAFTAEESNQFRSFCYTDPKDREYHQARQPSSPRGTSTRSSSTTSSSSRPSTPPTSRRRATAAGRSSAST